MLKFGMGSPRRDGRRLWRQEVSQVKRSQGPGSHGTQVQEIKEALSTVATRLGVPEEMSRMPAKMFADDDVET